MKKIKFLIVFLVSLFVFEVTQAQEINFQFKNAGDTTLTNSDTIFFTLEKPLETYSGYLVVAGIHTSVSGTLSETITFQGTNDDLDNDNFAPLWWDIDTTEVSVYTGYKFTETPPRYLYYRTRHESSGTMESNVRERLIYKLPE